MEARMTLVQTERVLVVPTRLFHRLGHFQGFCPDVGRYLEELLSPEHTSFRTRSEMETDPAYKQLIPYVILRHVDENDRESVFTYTRGNGQGEGRLHAKRSIGIGGHISSDDADACQFHPYDEGMRRELEEEIAIETEYRDRCVGLINDDQTPVGEVHLGVVHLFDVVTPAVRPLEADLLDAGFRPVRELLADVGGFETWSQICLKALFA
jgi:predicted NUDIX family phosphoesterase